MPSSTSLLESEETEPELPPLVQTFAGIGLDDDPVEQPQTLLHSRPASHLGLLGAVLDLKPLSRTQAISEVEEDEKRIDEEVHDDMLCGQAQVSVRSSSMLSGVEAPTETALLFEDGLCDSTTPTIPGMMLLPSVYGEQEYEVEQSLLNIRRKSVTECVGVPSSEHVAEIVGRQGCKIKALRAKTNTYIKTPVRGEQPVFVVTGRKEDVAMAKREILSAAEHFSLIRATRNKAGPLAGVGVGLTGAPNLPGQTTIQVRVPYRVVGLVVGPKGATIKRIQQQTHTYIVTPSRDKEPVFEVTGMPENVDRAREEIEAHIALRTGGCLEMTGDENDFHYNGTDVSFEAGSCNAWMVSGASAQHPNGGCARINTNYRNNSSSSLGSTSNDSFYSGTGGNRVADLSPTSPYNSSSGTGTFWFGETLMPVGSEELAGVESAGFEGLAVSGGACGAQPPLVWSPFEQGVQVYDNPHASLRESQPATPRLSPSLPEALDPLVHLIHGDFTPSEAQRCPIYGPAFSSSSDSTTSSSPPESSGAAAAAFRARNDCVGCLESEVVAALVPCGHSLFCIECANRICQSTEPICPKCHVQVTQAIRLRNV